MVEKTAQKGAEDAGAARARAGDGSGRGDGVTPETAADAGRASGADAGGQSSAAGDRDGRGARQRTLVRYATEGAVALLELSDPPANTYTHEMMRQLDEAILRARMDDDVQVIVIRGEGEKFFCAGANITMLQSVTPRFKYFFCLHANETLNRLEQTPKLVIGALNGHTVGGGMEIAMACDFRYAWKPTAEGAKPFQYGLPEVNLGVLPGTGGTQRLSRLIRKDLAIYHMTSGRTFGVEEARELGLLTDVIEAASLDAFVQRVTEIARGYCAPAKAAKAVGLIKRAVQSGAEASFGEGLAIERELQQQLFQSEDAKEGLGAYNEKRKASFGGA
ncbi:MAG: enoyl-CoA hydratase/isomerase family protein [Gemmatimonadetes bacterium]|nr:enoyl-CoA hydratase/isomerase family protein [Gemmatimonadota bacterium]